MQIQEIFDNEINSKYTIELPVDETLDISRYIVSFLRCPFLFNTVGTIVNNNTLSIVNPAKKYDAAGFDAVMSKNEYYSHSIAYVDKAKRHSISLITAKGKVYLKANDETSFSKIYSVKSHISLR